MVRSRSFRFLVAWLVLVTGLAGAAREALGLGCRYQSRTARVDGDRRGAAIALGDVASGSGTLAVEPRRDSQETVPLVPAALSSVCTPAPALPTRAAQLAPPALVGLEVTPWRPEQHASFVPPPLFHPPRLG